MDSDPEQGKQEEGTGTPAETQSSGATRGTGTTLAIGCIILFIVLTAALAFVAQQFR